MTRSLTNHGASQTISRNLGVGLSDAQISKTPKSLIELERPSSLREREDTLIQEVSHILADERFEAEDVCTGTVRTLNPLATESDPLHASAWR